MNNSNAELSLYMRPMCLFCTRVQNSIKLLELDVTVTNIWQSREAAVELQSATGRGTVPVLRIVEADKVRWLSESQEIINFLSKHAARQID